MITVCHLYNNDYKAIELSIDELCTELIDTEVHFLVVVIVQIIDSYQTVAQGNELEEWSLKTGPNDFCCYKLCIFH